jgi:DNA-directed RNA polymerase specialized sigma24 family protein
VAPRRTDAERSISAEGLARLLARLHPDADRAAREYEQLRRTLVRFFDWRGGWPPEECADEALDRLARKLEADTAVEDVRNYAHGIARLVLLEWRRRPVASSIAEAPDLATVPAEPDETGDRLHECFDRCLAEIPGDNRSLVLGYYEGDRDAKIANRRRLASTHGLSENALRSRVQRVRDRLEQCVQTCVAIPL